MPYELNSGCLLDVLAQAALHVLSAIAAHRGIQTPAEVAWEAKLFGTVKTPHSPTKIDAILHLIERSVSLNAPRFGIPRQDWEDLAQEVALALCDLLDSADRNRAPRDITSYTHACVLNACRTFRRKQAPKRTRIHDAVIDTVRGRRNVSGLALWKVAGRSACGDEKWIDSTPRDTPRLLRLRDSLNEFGDHFDRNHIHRDIPSLVITLLDWAQTPLFVDELVELIFNLTGGSSEVPVSLDTGGGECGDEQPSALEIPDAAPGPEVQAFQRQMIAATALYACGLMRGRLGSWLWGLDRENVDTLFSACAEPSAWTRCFGEALEPSMTVADLDALIGLGDMPKAVHRRYAKRLETSERCHHRYLRVVPLGDVEIAKFLGVRTPNVPYLRWCAKQEFVALYDRAFGGPSE